MTPGARSQGQGKAHRAGSIVVVAGEDANDRKVIRELVTELCPGLSSRLVEIRDSVRLKTATGRNLDERVLTLVRKARAVAIRERAELTGLIVHEDMDSVTGPIYAAVRGRIADALGRGSPCGTALALAAWETEAWLLLFPDAFPKVRSAWRVPSAKRGRDTGLLSSPKELLRRELGRPEYRESDAPDIARMARQLGLIRRPPAGRNTSFEDFAADLRRLTLPRDGIVRKG